MKNMFNKEYKKKKPGSLTDANSLESALSKHK